MTPRILFVDDDVSVLNGLRRSFRDQQAVWDMSFAAGPEAALAASRKAPFDVVVSDLRMPGMGGIDLIIALRRVMPDALYLMLTGAADLRCTIDSINLAGVFRFFTKPCPSFLLKEGIGAALASRPAPASGPLAAPEPPAAPPSPGEAALDQLSMAVIVVGAAGQAVFMNRRGGELCAAADGLVLGGTGICRASSQAETARLHRLIRGAAERGERGAMAISRPSLKRSLSVVVAPLPLQPKNAEAGSVALYIADPEDMVPSSAEVLAMMLDLPPAKARLAHSLSLGHSLDEAAALSGVTIGTARTYLKEIFSRTGTARQSELVKLILSQPAIDP
ncbi:MAG: response regulator [Rhodospirillaceae bacterium]